MPCMERFAFQTGVLAWTGLAGPLRVNPSNTYGCARRGISWGFEARRLIAELFGLAPRRLHLSVKNQRSGMTSTSMFSRLPSTIAIALFRSSIGLMNSGLYQISGSTSSQANNLYCPGTIPSKRNRPEASVVTDLYRSVLFR